MTFTDREAAVLETELTAYAADEVSLREAKRTALNESLAAANASMSRLTDFFLDGQIDVAIHDEKRANLIVERQRITEELTAIEAGRTDYLGKLSKMFELLKTAQTLYESANPAKKRQLPEHVISNCSASGKSLEFRCTSHSRRLQNELLSATVDSSMTRIGLSSSKP